MIRSHRIHLNPTPEQRDYFVRAFGTRRFIYNWGLAEWNRQYQAGEQPSAVALKKQFNAVRGEQFPWTYEVTEFERAASHAALAAVECHQTGKKIRLSTATSDKGLPYDVGSKQRS
jgi:hypothetical protein